MDTNKRKITKHNDFIEASYKLTPTQAKLLCRLVTRVQPDDEDFKKYQFSAKDLLKEFGLGDEHYDLLKQSINRLVEKTFTIPEKDGVLVISIFSSAKYFYKNGLIELEFSPKMRPYLLSLKETFTTYNAENVLTLKSFYSIRLYELLKQYETIGKRAFTIDELRKYLAIEPKQYKAYKDFKRRVILQAERELKEKCDIYFEYKEHKTGRKITSITFIIIQKNKPKLALESPQTQNIDISNKEYQLEKLLKLGVSEKQAIKICKEHTIANIEDSLEIALTQKTKGGIEKGNIAGYLMGILKNMKSGNEYIAETKEQDRQQSTDREQKEVKRETRPIQTEKHISSIEEQEQLIKNKFKAYKNNKVNEYLAENKENITIFLKEFINIFHEDKPISYIIDFLKIDIRNINKTQLEDLRIALNKPNEIFKPSQLNLKLASKTFVSKFTDYILTQKLGISFEIYKSIIKG